MTIYLVRAGQTAWDAEGRVGGPVDVPLTEAGEAETRATAEALAPLKPAAIYCAPGEAARDTARILAKALHAKSKTLDGIRNINFGLWQGMLWREVEKRHPRAYRRLLEEPLSVAPPEGEALREVLQRVRAALVVLAGKHADGGIVLACSGDVCGFVRACVKGGRVEAPGPVESDAPQCQTIDVQVAGQAS